jgi:heme/copper-type cytochrome/quinol oxidase subunit 2
MPTQFTPVAASCDTLHLSRSVVRTAIISLIAVAIMALTVFCLIHFRSSVTRQQAGTTHFSAQSTHKMSPRQLSYTSQL